MTQTDRCPSCGKVLIACSCDGVAIHGLRVSKIATWPSDDAGVSRAAATNAAPCKICGAQGEDSGFRIRRTRCSNEHCRNRRVNMLPESWNAGFEQWECDVCDGCGWYEGGEHLKTTCKTCGGSGVVWRATATAAPSDADAGTPRDDLSPDRDVTLRFPGLSDEASLRLLSDTVYTYLGTRDAKAVAEWICQARSEVASLRASGAGTAAEGPSETIRELEIDALRCIVEFCETKGVGFGGWYQDHAVALVCVRTLLDNLAARHRGGPVT